MSDITLRQTKGTPLTNDEVDDNFNNLNEDKMEKGANLGDLSDIPAARENLNVQSTSESQTFAIAMAIALG